MVKKKNGTVNGKPRHIIPKFARTTNYNTHVHTTHTRNNYHIRIHSLYPPCMIGHLGDLKRGKFAHDCRSYNQLKRALRENELYEFHEARSYGQERFFFFLGFVWVEISEAKAPLSFLNDFLLMHIPRTRQAILNLDVFRYCNIDEWLRRAFFTMTFLLHGCR